MLLGSAPIHSSFKITLADKALGCEATLWVNSINVGSAIFRNNESEILLSWIEIKNNYQRKGHASYLLNYIIDNHIPCDKMFKINVVDEETLEFYYKFMNKRGFDTISLNKYIEDSEHHPELIFPAGTLSAPIKERKKLSF